MYSDFFPLSNGLYVSFLLFEKSFPHMIFRHFYKICYLGKSMILFLLNELLGKKYLFLKEIFCPQDMIGLLRSNLGIFSIAKVWCCLGFYIALPGVVIWQHIHPSTLHSFWEEGWQDSSCLRFFLGLRI